MIVAPLSTVQASVHPVWGVTEAVRPAAPAVTGEAAVMTGTTGAATTEMDFVPVAVVPAAFVTTQLRVIGVAVPSV